MESSSEVYRRNNNGPQTLHCGTYGTTITGLLQQPSTILCCDRYGGNCVNIEPPIYSQSIAHVEFTDYYYYYYYYY